MRFSHQVHYAICGVFDLAYNGEDGPVQVRVIGERQGIPARYLEQIFQRLRRADLVSGKRGPRGGYRLARAAGDITIRDVIEAVEGPISLSFELDSAPGSTEQNRPSFLWPQLAEEVAAVLGDVTIESICKQAMRNSVTRANAEQFTYQI
jgi:Rrf2 family protein